MKEFAIMAVLSVLVATQALASDKDTKAYLSADTLTERLYVEKRGTTLKYKTTDSALFLDDLSDAQTFVAPSGVGVVVKNFAPLKTVFTVGDKGAKDVTFDISKFTDALGTLQTATGVAVAPAAVAPLGAPNPNPSLLAFVSPAPAPALSPAPGNDCNKLTDMYNNLNTALQTKISIDANGMKKWSDQAVGQAKVSIVLSDIQGNIDALTANIAAYKKALDNIDNFNSTSNPVCTKITVNDLYAVGSIKKANDEIQKETALLDYLNKVKEYLSPFEADYQNSCAWVDNKMDYYCTVAAPDASTQREVTITLADRTFKTQKTPLTFETDSKTTVVRNIVVHEKSYILPEIGAAAIYSGLSYPNWGTKTVNGQTVVSGAGSISDPVHAAVTLNLIIAAPQNPVVYPEVQIGVATAKDYPALVAGGGLRFVTDKAFAITGGVILGWHKTLNKLQEGDVVTGTADIQNDMSTKLFKSWFVGIQYNFQ